MRCFTWSVAASRAAPVYPWLVQPGFYNDQSHINLVENCNYAGAPSQDPPQAGPPHLGGERACCPQAGNKRSVRPKGQVSVIFWCIICSAFEAVQNETGVGEKRRVSSDLRLLLSLYLSARESVFFPRNLKWWQWYENRLQWSGHCKTFSRQSSTFWLRGPGTEYLLVKPPAVSPSVLEPLNGEKALEMEIVLICV